MKVIESVPNFLEFYDEMWLVDRIKKGHLQIWALSDGAIRGIVLTQVLQFPKQKVFEILGAGGVGLLRFFDELEEVFDRTAAIAGCQTISARLRPGLERLLRRKHGEVRAITVSRAVRQKERVQ